MSVLQPEQLQAVVTEWGTPPQAPKPTTLVSASRPTSSGSSFQHRLDVARWLTDRGIAFRVTPTPDHHNRTRFILAQCPFNPEHRDPDAAIFQADNGQLGARCFHNSCQGRAWKDFRDQIGKPEAHHYDPPLPNKQRPSANQQANTNSCPPEGPSPEPPTTCPEEPASRPTILAYNQQLSDMADQALEALIQANQPTSLVVSQGLLTRLRRGQPDQPPRLEVLHHEALLARLAYAANWIKRDVTKDGERITQVPPPSNVVQTISGLDQWAGLPIVDSIVSTPVFTLSGQLMTQPGYNPEARLWYEPPPGFDVPTIPQAPTREQIDEARDLLLHDLLGDFPFVDQASKAHTLALLLLPFVRPMIRGHTPLHLIDAPTEGTGKTLLVQVLTTIAQGYPAEASPEVDNPDEWRKRLTALLVEGRQLLWFDNLNETLDSGALASVLTTRSWSDRILGVSKMAHAQNRATWMATGNNVALSRELVRRTLWIRLNARVERPAERTGYRHPKLLEWVEQNRSALVQAALTLVQGWIHHGQPQGQQTMGMFEDWVEVMGGILDVAGVPGLLDNRPQFQQQQQSSTDDWPAFLLEWWNRIGSQPVGVAQLIQLAIDGQYLDEVLGDGGPKSQRIRFGKRLAKLLDRVIGSFLLASAGSDHKDRQLYRLTNLKAQTTPEDIARTIGH